MMSSVTGGWPLALVILLLVSMDPTATEVVNSVNDCTEFFRGGTPPEIPLVLVQGNILNQNRYKPICQTYKNIRRFMTLYDTDKKIPVFSAYKYTGHTQFPYPGVIGPWSLEPEFDYQAKLNNYKGQCFDKGHLFPRSHANSKDDQKSTYKLTNAVPQDPSFNSGRWRVIEKKVKTLMDDCFRDFENPVDAFVITGAIPGDEKMPNTNVAIPKVLWTAFCCISIKHSVSGAAYDVNKHNDEELPYKDIITLEQLKTDLYLEPFPKGICHAKISSVDSRKRPRIN